MTSELFREIEQMIPLVDGWCIPQKACDFAAIILALRPAVTIECGVWGGRGTLAMAMAHRYIRGGRVIAVDPWSAGDSVVGQVDQNAAWWSDQAKHDLVYARFLAHITTFGVGPFIDVRKERSDTFKLPEAAALVVIDGNHSDQAVKDVERLAPIIPVGGMLYLDDLNWSGGGVQRAAELAVSLGFVERFQRDEGAFFQRVSLSVYCYDIGAH